MDQAADDIRKCPFAQPVPSKTLTAGAVYLTLSLRYRGWALLGSRVTAILLGRGADVVSRRPGSRTPVIRRGIIQSPPSFCRPSGDGRSALRVASKNNSFFVVYAPLLCDLHNRKACAPSRACGRGHFAVRENISCLGTCGSE
jgi:hypothetical protein